MVAILEIRVANISRMVPYHKFDDCKYKSLRSCKIWKSLGGGILNHIRLCVFLYQYKILKCSDLGNKQTVVLAVITFQYLKKL